MTEGLMVNELLGYEKDTYMDAGRTLTGIAGEKNYRGWTEPLDVRVLAAIN